jgi:mannose-6-phosphate isomerase-like protein (cupin superfamily)
MSYPLPRYFNETGAVSASLRQADQEPELTYPSGVTVHYLATGASTDGEFGLYRWDFGPTVSGPDPHFHKTISESFYILSGAVHLYDGDKWVETAPGDYLFVPEGGIHAFKNEDVEAASMLILFAPGAPREDYFETLAEVARGRVLSDEERTEFYLRHDTYWL